MPKSSHYKSHKHSKHSSKDVRDYSDSDEDLRIKELIKEEDSARFSRTLGSSEKRKDPPSHSNGDVAEEYVSSKRRREKEKGDVSVVLDRWTGGGAAEREMKVENLGIDGEKALKLKSFGGDSQSKSSRGCDIVGEKKEESKEGIQIDSKRKYEKEFGKKEAQLEKDFKDIKDKVKVVEKEKEKKVKKIVEEVEDEVVDIGDVIIPAVFFGEGQDGKHGMENNVWHAQDERVPESEKEIEKRRRKRDDSYEKDKYQDEIKGSGDKRISSRGDRGKDEKYKNEKYKYRNYRDQQREELEREARYTDEKYKDGNHKDQQREELEREARYTDEKYKDGNHKDQQREELEREARYTDEKYKDGNCKDQQREELEREARYKDGKYVEDVDRERRYKDAKYRENSDKIIRHKDDKYREDVDRDKRPRDDRDRDIKYRDAKYCEDGEKDYRRRSDKYHEDAERDDRKRDDSYYYEEYNRDNRIREEKNWEDGGRGTRRREGKQRDEIIKDKSIARDGINENFDIKRSRDENEVADYRHKRLNTRDSIPNIDDRSSRYKDDRVKRRANDREEYDVSRGRGIKEQQVDLEKKYSNARVESVGNRGRSSLRDADMVISPNHARRGDSPSYRPVKQEESRYKEYPHGGRERRDVTPGKEYSGLNEKVSRLNEKSIQKDDGYGDDASYERRSKEDTIIKSPTSSNYRGNYRRDNIRNSLDVEDSGQRTGGSKEIKDYYNRGNRELPIENPSQDVISQPDAENLSAASPFTKPNHFNNNNTNNNNNSRSLLPSTPFRGGPDRPFDDDNRNNSNKFNRRRRMEPNMGRNPQWRGGVPNWPSPVANGFVPFQHGPTLGFHPVMPQFPNPPMFGVRPPMDMTQFHGRPIGWDGNNPIFGNDPQFYWDHNNKNINSGRGWESNRDIWKGQNTGVVGSELSSVSQKDDFSAHGKGDEDETDKKQLNIQVESVDSDNLNDGVERDGAEALKKDIAEDISDSEIRDDAYFSRSYLSVLDISEELSGYELYSEYTDLVGRDQNAKFEGNDTKILIMEEDIEALEKDSKKTSNASLFCTMTDSIFQKAMSMYKKLKRGGQDNVPSDPMEAVLNDQEAPIEIIPFLLQKEAEIAVSDLKKVKTEASSNEMKMEIDPIIKEEIEDNKVEDISLSLKEVIMDSADCNEGHNLKDGKFVPLPFSGASTEVGNEGVIESGLVNLSRIHQSPESTH